MKFLRLTIAASGLFIVTAATGYSQHSIKISGTLCDSLTHEPIRFATVVLLNQQTKIPVKGTNTDTSGYFVFETLPGWTFTLRITYVG